MSTTLSISAITEEGTKELESFESGTVSIGRDEDNRMPIESEAVSGLHGEFLQAGPYWIYHDLGSTNGSWVNEVKLESGILKLLRDGDIVRVADYILKISFATDSKTH